MPFSKHLRSPKDLLTPYEETRAGFISLALEKNRKATPFVQEAKVLKVMAAKAKEPQALLRIGEIQNSLLTAAGVSNKAKTHLSELDKIRATKELIKNFLEPAGASFIDELVYRFLLTRGDALGGSIRNLAGSLGEWRFTRILIFTCSVSGRAFEYLDSKNGRWMPYQAEPETYIALGELKGGIDPAGADEHWKTANSALIRIREAFSGDDRTPKTFFIGAAIASAMAEEIYQQLSDQTLSNAANLTNEAQVISLCDWLIKV